MGRGGVKDDAFCSKSGCTSPVVCLLRRCTVLVTIWGFRCAKEVEEGPNWATGLN